MSPQMYLVECVLPKEPRERKALVRRWVIIASSNKDAIYAAAIQAFNEVIEGVEPEAEEIEDQLSQGVWSASMVGQGMRLPNIVR